MQIQMNTLTAEQFTELFRAARWDAPPLPQVEVALEHSFATFSAYDGDTVIGMVSLIGDCGMTFLIKDLIVREEYRGKGVGRGLMKAAEAEIRKHLQPDWNATIALMSLKETVPFYENTGFTHISRLDNGSGMVKMIDLNGNVKIE